MSEQQQPQDSDEETPKLKQLREEVTYPVINPTVVPVQIDENTLHIRGGPWKGPILTLTDHDEEDIIERILELIDGETHIDDILGAFHHDNKGEVARALAQLADKHAIHSAEDYEEDATYHHTALKPFQATEEYTNNITTDSVAVIAASDIAAQLVSDVKGMQIESLTVSEPVGSTTARAAIDVPVTDDDVESVVSDNDFVVYAAEQPYPELEKRINETAQETGTPWMPVQRIGYDGMVGPTIFPGKTACYECFTQRKLSNIVSYEKYKAYRNAYEDTETETLPEFNRMLAGMAAMDLRHLFAHGVGYTAGRVIAVSSLDLNMHADRVLKLPRCDVCGPDAGESSAPMINLEDFVQVNAPERYNGE